MSLYKVTKNLARFISYSPLGRGLQKGYTMAEETTTEASVDEGVSIQGVAVDDSGRALTETQPTEDTESAEAVQETTEPTETTNDEETPPEPSKDDNSTEDWLKAKGIDPSSPEAVKKVAEMARNAEKAMHQKAQKASELEKSMQTTVEAEEQQHEIATGQVLNESDKLVRRLYVKDTLRTFYENNPEARQYDKAMAEVVAQRPHLAGDLDAIYALARSKDVDTIKSQTKQETLRNLAQKQQAAVPQGNAVSPTGTGGQKITPQNVDRLVGENDLNWYMAHQDEINQAMAG